MSEENTNTPETTENKEFKARGVNDQASPQHYVARPSKALKRSTEMYKRIVGRNRLTPKERSTLAFFTYRVEERGE